MAHPPTSRAHAAALRMRVIRCRLICTSMRPSICMPANMTAWQHVGNAHLVRHVVSHPCCSCSASHLFLHLHCVGPCTLCTEQGDVQKPAKDVSELGFSMEWRVITRKGCAEMLQCLWRLGTAHLRRMATYLTSVTVIISILRLVYLVRPCWNWRSRRRNTGL